MENASDALIMAGQILIFIVALTVCISSFTTLRTEVNRIIGESETIKFAKGTNGYINYIESKQHGSSRVVGAETVTSSIYRGIKENYVIYLKLKNDNIIDENIINVTKATKKITIDGTQVINIGDKIIKITIGVDSNQNVNKILSEGKLYEQIKESRFHEYLGEYQNNSTVTSENKPVHRIITYVEI